MFFNWEYRTIKLGQIDDSVKISRQNPIMRLALGFQLSQAS